MDDKSWFDTWFSQLSDRLGAWGERARAFSHRGVAVTPSGKWMHWVATRTPTTCKFCDDAHGKIIDPADPQTLPMLDGVPTAPPAHPNCRCAILPLPAMKAGTATIQGKEGADWYVLFMGELPPGYLTKREAKARGWHSKRGDLGDVLSGASIGGDIYWNRDAHLPVGSNRTWYEADIHYTHGFRGDHRIVYSSDGLVFVTYDHFRTFFEIIP